MTDLQDLAAEGQQRFVEDYSERDEPVNNTYKLSEERNDDEWK